MARICEIPSGAQAASREHGSRLANVTVSAHEHQNNIEKCRCGCTKNCTEGDHLSSPKSLKFVEYGPA
jgi:hypothetical protein